MWQTELVEILRVLVNDMDSTNYKFADDTLQRVLIVAGRQIGLEMAFSQTFTADIDALNFTPDPTNDAGGTRDDSFNNLCCLKAACIIDRGQAMDAANKAVRVKDGSSSVDLLGMLQGKLKLLQQGWCAVYQDAKKEYMAGQVRVAGAAVMGPFRIFAGSGGYLVSGDRNRNLIY